MLATKRNREDVGRYVSELGSHQGLLKMYSQATPIQNDTRILMSGGITYVGKQTASLHIVNIAAIRKAKEAQQTEESSESLARPAASTASASAAPGAISIAAAVEKSADVNGVEEFNSQSQKQQLDISEYVTPVDVGSDFPTDLAQHTAVTADGVNVYIIGNYCERHWNIWKVDTVQLKAEKVQLARGSTPLPPNLHCHTSVLIDKENKSPQGPRVYTFGGANFKDSTNAMYVFYLNTHKWERVIIPPSAPLPAESDEDGDELRPAFTAVSNIPGKRLYHVSATDGQRYVYVYGGAPDVKSTTTNDPVYNDMWEFDSETRRWRLVQQMVTRGTQQIPSARGSAVFQYIAPYFYLIGGYDGGASLHDIYRFDPASGAWTDITYRFGNAVCAPEEEEEGITFSYDDCLITPETTPATFSRQTSQQACPFLGVSPPNPYAPQQQNGSEAGKASDFSNISPHPSPASLGAFEAAEPPTATAPFPAASSSATAFDAEFDFAGKEEDRHQKPHVEMMKGRWAAGACLLHKSTVYLLGGFSSELNDLSEMELTDTVEALEIQPLTLKQQVARLVANNAKRLKDVLPSDEEEGEGMY